MKVFLLHRDRDFDVKPELRDEMFDAMLSGHPFAVTNVRRNRERARNAGLGTARPTSDDVLAQDLELDTLWNAMAAGDEFLFEMAKRGVLSSLGDPEAIVYRQRVLADCLEQPEIIGQIYRLAIEALQSERKAGGGLWHSDRPGTILHRSVAVLKLHVDVLRRLRQIADEHAEDFRSEGFTRFFAMLREELSDDYLQTVEEHLRELEFKRGMLESAELGQGQQGPPLHGAQDARAALDRAAAVREPPTGLQLHDPAPRRQRLRGAGGDSRQGHQPRRQRGRAVSRSHQELLRHAAPRARLLPGLREPARAPAREGRADLLPDPTRRWWPHARRAGHLRRLPHAPPR